MAAGNRCLRSFPPQHVSPLSFGEGQGVRWDRNSLTGAPAKHLQWRDIRARVYGTLNNNNWMVLNESNGAWNNNNYNNSNSCRCVK